MTRILMRVNIFDRRTFVDNGVAVSDALCADRLISVHLFSSGNFDHGHMFSVSFSV